jgi:hypothetical protein
MRAVRQSWVSDKSRRGIGEDPPFKGAPVPLCPTAEATGSGERVAPLQTGEPGEVSVG